MKKIFLILGLTFIVFVGWAGMFYYRNLRGAGPAVNPPVGDIAQSDSPEAENTTELPLTIPSGFSVSVFAKNLGGPRVLVWDPEGTLLASIPSQGNVVALPEGRIETVVDGLNRPHGLAFHDGKLYIAETDGVAMYDYNPDTRKATNKKELFDLPSGGNHFTRTIGFGPDGRLYVTIGSSCNVCVEKDSRRAKMLVANADGTNLKEYATGLRNSVFFIWHPVTKKLWATDMGRDLLGDNTPPEEVNIIEEGKDYGWPYCYGKQVADKSFGGTDEPCATTEPPVIEYQAHSAPLGLTFISEVVNLNAAASKLTISQWPEEYKGDLLVAYHGSWNKSVPTGYKIVRFDVNNNYAPIDFITGWLQGDSAFGRPVDLLFDKEGNLFISDDKAGVIYRVSHR